MTTWFCDYAVLPSGVARHVRITVEGDRIVEVVKRAKRAEGDTHLRGVTLPGAAMDTATPSIARCGGAPMARVATSGPGATRCMP